MREITPIDVTMFFTLSLILKILTTIIKNISKSAIIRHIIRGFIFSWLNPFTQFICICIIVLTFLEVFDFRGHSFVDL